MTEFNNMSLQPELMQALDKMNFTNPTPIQAKAIPLILDGKDILASAQTGTGKTGAFCIPLLEMMMQEDQSYALILTPTRELAQQIFDVATDLTKRIRKIRPSLMVGGKPIHKQISHLKSKPRFLVATPGRVIDLLDRGVLNLKAVQYLVLDETDRMLDMGFSIQVNQILRSIPKERQTLLFSATVSKVIESMSQKYLNEPVRIEMGGSQQPAKNIVQETITVGNVIKFDTLVDELERRGGTSIVFSRTKRGADKVAKNLNHEGLKAAAIHGDLNQRQRERVLKQFRDQKINIMVATDVAARGIDVSHVSLVVNYDLPQSPQDYIHRIGRTARAGAKGTALSFISPGQEAHWEAIEHFLETGQEIPIPKKGRAKRGGRGRNNSQGRRSGSQHGAKKTASGEGRKSSGGRFKGKATGAKKSSTSRGKKKTAGRGRKQEDAQPSRGRKTKSTASKHANQDRKASPSKKRGQRKDDKQFSVKKSKRKPAKAQRSSAKKQRTKTPFA